MTNSDFQNNKKKPFDNRAKKCYDRLNHKGNDEEDRRNQVIQRWGRLVRVPMIFL